MRARLLRESLNAHGQRFPSGAEVCAGEAGWPAHRVAALLRHGAAVAVAERAAPTASPLAPRQTLDGTTAMDVTVGKVVAAVKRHARRRPEKTDALDVPMAADLQGGHLCPDSQE